MEPDFSLLYSELELPPDCTLDEFRRAYHRRITALHPDHNGGDPPSPEAQAVLARLISTYVAVKRFHRQYGRMPGAPTRPSAMYAAGSDPSLPSRSGLPVPVAAKDATVRTTWQLLILFLVVLVVLASWDWLMLDS